MTCWYARVTLLGQIRTPRSVGAPILRFPDSPIPLIAFRIHAVPSYPRTVVPSYALASRLGSRLEAL